MDRISHSQIKHIHKKCDIYVSLNKLGNLSNSNLECFSSGICSIVVDNLILFKRNFQKKYLILLIIGQELITMEKIYIIKLLRF